MSAIVVQYTFAPVNTVIGGSVVLPVGTAVTVTDMANADPTTTTPVRMCSDITGSTPAPSNVVHTDASGNVTVFVTADGSDGTSRYKFTPAGLGTQILAVQPRDSSLLHQTGNETAAGNKTWTGDHLFRSGTPWYGVCAAGADPTGAADSTAAFVSAINGALATGGIWRIEKPGTYKVNLGGLPTINKRNVSGEGPGSGCCTIMAQGTTGDLLRVQTNPFSAVQAGGLKGVTIDGSATTGNLVMSGLHLGDITGFLLDDVVIQNFTSTLGYGLWVDNQLYFTERLTAKRLWLNNNTIGLRATVGSGGTITNSFDYWDVHIELNVNAGQVGIQWENNANITHSTLRVKANVAGAGTVMNLTGTTQLYGSLVEMLVEQTSGSGGIGVHTGATAAFQPCDGSVVHLANGLVNQKDAGAIVAVKGTGTFAYANSSGTPLVTIDAGALPSAAVCQISLNASCTGIKINGGATGQVLNLVVINGGAFTMAAPWNGTQTPNIVGGGTITSGAGKYSVQSFYFDSTNWIGTGPLFPAN